MPAAECGGADSLPLSDEARDGAARRGHRRRAASPATRRALGRSRRRQDDARPRADPRARRRPGARSAEPDLHARASITICRAAGRACRPLPAERRARSSTRSASTRRSGEGALLVEWPELLPAACRRTGSTSSSTLAAPAGGAEHRLAQRQLAASASRAALAIRELPRPSRLGEATRMPHCRRRLDPRLRAPRSSRPARPRILMNSPPRGRTGPPVRDGKLLRRRRAHRAIDVRAFVAIDARCAAPASARRRSSRPIWSQGLLLLEDLGGEGIVDADGAPILERYAAAIELLVHDARTRTGPTSCRCPTVASPRAALRPRGAADRSSSFFPTGTCRRMRASRACPTDQRADFLAAWSKLLDRIAGRNTTWMLRDFHSPNLIWLAGAAGLRARRPHRFPGRLDRAIRPTTSPRSPRMPA